MAWVAKAMCRDHSKLGTVSKHLICPCNEIDELIIGRALVFLGRRKTQSGVGFSARRCSALAERLTAINTRYGVAT